MQFLNYAVGDYCISLFPRIKIASCVFDFLSAVQHNSPCAIDTEQLEAFTGQSMSAENAQTVVTQALGKWCFKDHYSHEAALSLLLHKANATSVLNGKFWRDAGKDISFSADEAYAVYRLLSAAAKSDTPLKPLPFGATRTLPATIPSHMSSAVERVIDRCAPRSRSALERVIAAAITHIH